MEQGTKTSPVAETWRSVVGYMDLYEVSNLGRVRSLDRTYTLKDGRPQSAKGRIMSQTTTKCGYWSVRLRKPESRYTFRVHRLVAQAFLENPDGLPYINHKDENKKNNRVDNLEWCTPKYNINYGSTREKLSASHKQNPIYSKPVEQYTMDGQFIRSYPSAKEAAKQTGLYAQNIGACCRGIYAHSGGFHWRYITEPKLD